MGKRLKMDVSERIKLSHALLKVERKRDLDDAMAKILSSLPQLLCEERSRHITKLNRLVVLYRARCKAPATCDDDKEFYKENRSALGG